MAKLLKQILKEDLKILLPTWLASLAIALGLVISNAYFGNKITYIIRTISFVVVYAGIGICAYAVITGDSQRFFGRHAAFYQSLPLKSGQILSARFLNYVITSILTVLVAIISLVIIIISISSISFSEFWQGILQVLRHLKDVEIDNIDFLLVILTVITGYISFVLSIIYSINIGSEKLFKSIGKFGPVLVFILVNLVLNLIKLLYLNVFNLGSTTTINLNQAGPDIAESLFVISIVVCIISSIYFVVRSNYSQNKRLTVG